MDSNRDLRNRCFELSSTRGVYPLVFVREGPDAFRYIGTIETIEELNENHTSARPLVAALGLSDTSGEPPLPDGWIKCTTGDGKVYYANKATKVCASCVRVPWLSAPPRTTIPECGSPTHCAVLCRNPRG